MELENSKKRVQATYLEPYVKKTWAFSQALTPSKLEEKMKKMKYFHTSTSIIICKAPILDTWWREKKKEEAKAFSTSLEMKTT